MADVTVRDPVLLEEKNVDSGGKIYLGQDFAGMKAKIIIERVEADGE